MCGPAAQTSIYLWSFKPHYFHIFPFRNKISTYFQCQYPTLWWSWCRVTCLYCRRWDRRSPNMVLHIINISTIRRLSMPKKICGKSYMEIWNIYCDNIHYKINFCITKSPHMKRWLRKHIWHVSDGHFLYYNYVRSSRSPHVVTRIHTRVTNHTDSI